MVRYLCYIRLRGYPTLEADADADAMLPASQISTRGCKTND